jgi:hypothetical protein
MPQYWLKPLGVTQPLAPMPNAWTVGADLDDFALITGSGHAAATAADGSR